MSGILCAVRGGPASQPTIHKSIQLAQETGLTIYFLYVVNLDFMSATASSRYHTIDQEMIRLGEFILLIAEENAQSQGVQAEGRVQHGNVQEEIIKLCAELQADYVVLGSPRQTTNADVLGDERMQQFCERIATEGGASVVLAGED